MKELCSLMGRKWFYYQEWLRFNYGRQTMINELLFYGS